MKTLVPSWTIRGEDGNDLTVSETPEGAQVVISIHQNDENGRVATVRLNKAQWDALYEIRYKVDTLKGVSECHDLP